jgi:hypothetical protein
MARNARYPMRIDPDADQLVDYWIKPPPPTMEGDPRLGMREADLQQGVVELAQALGFLVYHTHDSRRSAEGFPDLVLVNAHRRRTLFVELKAMRGHVSDAQRRWLQGLAEAGNHVHLWTPVDWFTGSIERELRGPRI